MQYVMTPRSQLINRQSIKYLYNPTDAIPYPFMASNSHLLRISICEGLHVGHLKLLVGWGTCLATRALRLYTGVRTCIEHDAFVYKRMHIRIISLGKGEKRHLGIIS